MTQDNHCVHFQLQLNEELMPVKELQNICVAKWCYSDVYSHVCNPVSVESLYYMSNFLFVY